MDKFYFKLIHQSWPMHLLAWGVLGSAFFGAAQESAPEKSTRIVRVHSGAATDTFLADQGVALRMTQKSVMAWTGMPDMKSAWASVLDPDDVIGIQVYSTPGPIVGTTPVIVEALIREILDAGFKPDQLVIWDKYETDLRRAGFGSLSRKFGVRLAGARDVGYDPNVYYESSLPGQLIWGDLEFGNDQRLKSGGRRSYVSKLLTRDITRIIQVMPLMNHNSVEIAGNLMNLAFSACDNMTRFEGEPELMEVAVPEIVGLQAEAKHVRLSEKDRKKYEGLGYVRPLADRVALCVMDALICQYRGETEALLHYSSTLNEIWVSADPVALDVHGVEIIHRQRRLSDVAKRRESNEDLSSLGDDKKLPRWRLFQNAALLELGEWDQGKLRVEQVPF